MKLKAIFMGVLSMLIFLSGCQMRIGGIRSEQTCDIQLMDAIENGSLEAAKEAIANGANLDIATDQKKNPLYEAMDLKRIAIMQFLLEKGANPNYIDSSGISLLMYAAGTKKPGINDDNVINIDYCKLLLDHGADVNLKDKNGCTALDNAIEFGASDEIITFLLDTGAIVSKKTVKAINETLKHNICNYSIAKKVIVLANAKGISLDISPLLQSVILNDFSKFNNLIKLNAWQNTDKVNVLFFAAACSDSQFLKTLSKQGISMDEKDGHGNTPIIVASQNGNLEAVRYLVNQKVNIEAKNFIDGETAFTKAIRVSHLDIAKYLLNSGAIMQVESENEEEISSFSNGTSKDIAEHVDDLEIAAVTGNLDVIKFIKNSGYPMNNGHIFNAASDAAMYGKMESLKYFLPSVTNDNRSYLLEDACAFGHVINMDIIKYLVENGADVNGNGNSSGPLIAACQSGNIDLVKYFIENGATVNSSDNLDSPIKTAITYGFINIVELLAEKGAKIDDSTIQFADETGCKNISKLLKSYMQK